MNHDNILASDLLKTIFDDFSTAARVGQRIQVAADAAMRAEREADEETDKTIEVLRSAVDSAEKKRDIQPWNDDLNPQ